MYNTVDYTKLGPIKAEHHYVYKTKRLFMSIVGMLGWMITLRQDVAHAYSVMSRFTLRPGNRHWK